MMYAPSYGFATPNHNGPPQQNPQQHLQQQHQHQHQHQQNMMYNPGQPQQQQPQHPYGAGPNHAPGPNMYGGPGNNGGMMQNTGLAHAGAGHVASPYQTPYTSSPYGASMPTATTASAPLPPNYIHSAPNAPAFQMSANQSNMLQQQQQQRMHPPSSTSTPQPNTGPRASPYGGAPQGTPPNSAPLQQSQFSTPQTSNPHSNQQHLQNPSNPQQQGGGGVITPQTPNFPPGAGNAASHMPATPLSPGSESREKERVSLLLEINSELLKEAVRLQALQKENTANSPESASGEKDGAEKEKTESKAAKWKECMRRLQCNLAYLAAIADRSHKPSSQIPPHPAIMSAPPLGSKPTSPATASPKPKSETKESGDQDEEKGESILREQYQKLQALFPGVDPNKEPPMQPVMKKPQGQTQTQGQGQAQAQGQGQGQMDNQQMLKAQMQQRIEQQAKQQQQHQQAQQNMQQNMHQNIQHNIQQNMQQMQHQQQQQHQQQPPANR